MKQNNRIPKNFIWEHTHSGTGRGGRLEIIHKHTSTYSCHCSNRQWGWRLQKRYWTQENNNSKDLGNSHNHMHITCKYLDNKKSIPKIRVQMTWESIPAPQILHWSLICLSPLTTSASFPTGLKGPAFGNPLRTGPFPPNLYLPGPSHPPGYFLKNPSLNFHPHVRIPVPLHYTSLSAFTARANL